MLTLEKSKVASRLRKRLLFVVNDPGFFVSHRLPIALGALRAGLEVWLASPQGNAVKEIEESGIHYVELPLLRASKNPVLELRSIGALASIIRRVRPDILHLITMKPVLYTGLLLRATSVPLSVFAVSGLGYSFIAKGVRARILRGGLVAGLRLALRQPRSVVIFQNPDDRDLFIAQGMVNNDQVRMIKGSGTDLDAIRPAPEPRGQLVVILPARMLWDKGVREFVEAARIVRAQRGDVRFVLSGKVDSQNPAAVPLSQLMAWNDEGAVEWLPHTDNIGKRLAESHLVVLPSYREGLPKSLVDAAAAGRAVVTTDTPGCRHAIVPGKTGLLVPPRDAQALAKAITLLLQDSRLRQEMGRAARRLAEADYSIESVVGKHLAIYAERNGNGQSVTR